MSTHSKQRILASTRRVVLLALFACLTILPWQGSHPQPVMAQGSSVYDLIAAVNAFRAANGLPAYEINDALMAAAQAHSDYQASIGSWTHTGAGGSTPKSRAMAAGYGEGAAVFVTENIAAGNNMNAQQAVVIWQGDSLHLNTMLHTTATDVGAGVATSGKTVFYTLDVGYVSGSGSGSGNPQPVTPGSGSQPATAGPPPTREIIMAVKIATPRPDGAIVHVVEPGQALFSIATAYKVDLATLLALNTGMTEKSIIYPGEKILIKAPDRTITPSLAVTETMAEPSATLRPATTAPPRPSATATSRTQATATPAATSTPEPDGEVKAGASPGIDPLLVVIGLLFFAGLALVTTGSLLKRDFHS